MTIKGNLLHRDSRFYRYALVKQHKLYKSTLVFVLALVVLYNTDLLNFFEGQRINYTPQCGRGRLTTEWRLNGQASPRLSVNPACPDDAMIQSVSSSSQTANSDDDRITIAFVYYQAPHLLAQQLDTISKWPQELRDRFEFLVIDDGSPVGWRVEDLLRHGGAAATLEIQRMLASLSLHVYRIEPDLPWNIGGARNLAMHLAPTEHVMLMDLDVTIPSQLASYLIQKAQTTRKADGMDVIYQHFDRIKDNWGKEPHPGVIFLTKSAYWKTGGCDEDFVGEYGSTDPHLRFRAEHTAGIELVNASIEMQALKIAPLRGIAGRFNACPASFTTCAGDKRPPASPPRSDINKRLLAKKEQGRVPWSNEYLRFTWSRVDALA